MRREGRVHGCNLQAGRRYSGYVRGKTSKPTNQSKSTARRPIEKAEGIKISDFGPLEPLPRGKAKVTSSLKAKNFDVTCLVQDWKVYDHRQGDSPDTCDCSNPHCELWHDDDEVSFGAYGENEEEEASFDGSPVVPMEVLLSTAKRDCRMKRTYNSREKKEQEQEQEFSLMDDDDDVEFILEQACSSNGLSEDFENWWRIEFSPQRKMSLEEWYLV